jgi:hypothetical protein
VRILLDHCLPRRLARAFPTHAVRTTADEGWEKLLNGALLAVAAGGFDVFLTIDKKLKHQQNLATLPIAVNLLPFVPAVEEELNRIRPCTLVEVTLP